MPSQDDVVDDTQDVVVTTEMKLLSGAVLATPLLFWLFSRKSKEGKKCKKFKRVPVKVCADYKERSTPWNCRRFKKVKVLKKVCAKY